MIMIVAAFLLPMLVVAQEWVEHTVAGNFNGAQSVYATDLDLDGDVDVLGAAYDGDDITWWENEGGEGIIWTEHVLSGDFGGASSVFAIDINGDLDLDVIGAAYDWDYIHWWENWNNEAHLYIEHSVNEMFYGVATVFADDVDGDGDNDILGASRISNTIAWWENVNGDGLTWTDHLVDGAFDGAYSVYATDMDLDGDVDVLGAAYDDDDITWWENVNGDGLTWTEHIVDDNVDGAICVFAIDVDGDNDLDVQGAARLGNYISWWENVDGDGLTWTEHLVRESFSGAYSVYATDMDRDNDADIMGAARDANDITWWENVDGNGLNWIEHVVDAEFDDAWSVYAADVNGDGAVDILGAGYYADDITWWEQPGPFPLRVVSPNGGESWRIGTPQTIQWVPGSDSDVYIELLDGPFAVMVISEGTENDGAFELIVPPDTELGDDYRIRLTLLSGEEQDVSDGAFAITALPSLTITPHNPPIIIPAAGDGFMYWVEVGNPSPFPGTGQLWTEVILPSNATYGPLQIVPVTLDGGEIFAPTEPFPQWIPAYAPAGMYEYVIHLGIHPGLIVATDSFEFEKLVGANVRSLPESAWSTDDWQNDAWEHVAGTYFENDTPKLPSEFTISPAHPNPFNASTSVTLNLPEATDLSVVIFNVNGQQVAELANGQFDSGRHTMTFSATGMASGLYFIRAVAPDQMNEVQKVMLVR
jgi:FG-GAP-like repeat/Secretion system C-terminal sorting domain/Kre9/KNH-like N-terminal Ig-like domain